MEITPEMLYAAIRKAVENGTIPKRGDTETYIKIWNSMKEILNAALERSNQ